MNLVSDEKLFQSLKELNIIDDLLLDSIYKESIDQKKSFYEILASKDLIKDSEIGQIIADYMSLKFILLENKKIDKNVLNFLPEVVSRSQNLICFEETPKSILVATCGQVYDELVLKFLQKKVGKKIELFYATPKDIQKAFSFYKDEIKEAYQDIILKNVSLKTKDEMPIIKIVDTVIEYAYVNTASDIHIEPQDNISVVRFRIDGILHDVLNLPLDVHEKVVTRIKVMAGLRTDEHMAAQDGKIIQKLPSENLDLRVSVVPITEGEKIVLRLLSEKSRSFNLHDLGFSENILKKVEEAFNKPHGMILSTGPTGSGKTTTLYAILKLLNKRDINIMTIEDPVEYDMDGVNQIAVNRKAELDFASGLRSIVRQDPDVILVGEIRDEETAGISINAALTGHLVLSTLHTNDSATAFPRLSDMKVEPFLVASSVNVIIAQRLVRKICQDCRKSVEKNIKEMGGMMRVYEGVGCPSCHHTGYLGRVGIFEVLVVDDEIREAITSNKDSSEILKIARKNGMQTMYEDGIEKVKQGITTIEEVLRVTKN